MILGLKTKMFANKKKTFEEAINNDYYNKILYKVCNNNHIMLVEDLLGTHRTSKASSAVR